MFNLDEVYGTYLHSDKRFRIDGVPEKTSSNVSEIQNTVTISKPKEVAPVIKKDFVLRSTGYAEATIVVDGKEVHNEMLQPRKSYSFDFNKEIEIWTDNVSLLEIDLKGERISPQGAVANERKLIFTIDKDML